MKALVQSLPHCSQPKCVQIIDTSGSAFKPNKEYEHKGPITFGALKFVSMNMRAIMCFYACEAD